MKRSLPFLIVSSVLFLCWISWLAVLAATTAHPVVLSRPQFLSADLYVLARLEGGDEPAETVTVKQVVWAANPKAANAEKIKVKNLGRIDRQHGWEGPGEYILALTASRDGPEVFFVTPLPRTPGYPGAALGRIYVAEPFTLEQLGQLKGEFHP